MNSVAGRFSTQGGVLGRFRLLGIVLFIFVLLGSSWIAEMFIVDHSEKNWEHVVEDVGRKYIVRAEQEFVAAQRTTRRIITEVAQHAEVLSSLDGTQPDRSALSRYISSVSHQHDIGLEVFDRNGALLVWEGRSGPATHREVQIALDGQLTSYVNPGPIYSHLFVTTPVRLDSKIVGAVIGRQAIEVNYPLSNKFINREGLSLRLSQEFGVPVEFNFSQGAELRKDGRYISARLYGIDSSAVGVVSVLRPSRSVYIETSIQPFRQTNVLLITVLVAIVGFLSGRKIGTIRSVFLRCITLSVLIWFVRYGLLLVDFPGSFITVNVFDPAYFASPFGGGLAKSIGEMTLSVLALLLNTVIILRYVLGSIRRQSPWWYPHNGFVRTALSVASVILVYLLLRGYGAVLRSVVFDSTLNYSDPGVIVPSFQLGLMIVNLFLLSFCLIVATVGLTSFMLSLFARPTSTGWLPRMSWIVVGGLFLLAAVLFGVFQPNPLMSTEYRIIFGVLALAFTYYLHYRVRQGEPLATLGNFLIALAISAMFFYPLLDENVHEKDRTRLEAFAAEVVRPVDGWLAFVVNEALAGFVSEETMDVLTGQRAEDIEKLAFTHWARSAASREGYNCRFAFIDTQRQPVSQFSLGSQTFFDDQMHFIKELPDVKSIQVREIGSGISAIKVYVGSVPIVGADNGLLGWGVVIVSAGQQSLFRGESPAILRSVSQENIESFYRRVTMSEFRNGVLFTTTNPELPLGHTLPQTVKRELEDPARLSLWFEEHVNDLSFETFVAKRSHGETSVIALSLERLGIQWYLFNVVKVVVYYAILVMCVVLGFLLFRWVRGVPYAFSFRDKLLGALLCTSIVPLIALAISGRTLARERLMESTSRRLEQETAAVASNIIPRAGHTAGEISSRFTPAIAEQLANDLGIDFNLYLGSALAASSRPELYEAGILDRRISGNAFAEVYSGGRRFHLETERIGEYQYAVGYAPLLDDNNTILGVVSVATLYQQEEIDQEVSKRNALLFGVYAVVLFVIVIVSTTFANRIASPIHRLTEATKRVSQGNLDVDVRVPNVDGEIGELITSFEKMTRDLKSSREELIQAERELAWKEMAKQVAHEIKNPLTPMKLSLQHLRQVYQDGAANFTQIFDEVSRTMIEQIDALSRIASEFSHFARMPQPQLESCNVNDVLKESVHLFEQDSQVRFDLALDKNLPSVMADREELRRAFINILRNSIQAMNNAGRIVIGTRPDAGQVIIRIQDSGFGIPEEMRSKLFQPNFSTKTDGMGLGLAIVKKTVDDLHGTIVVESTPGNGTVVTISLPVSSSQIS